MYSYFDGENWHEGLTAMAVKNLAKNGDIRRDTLIRLPDGREATADKIAGLEFGVDLATPIPVPTSPFVPVPEVPANASSSVNASRYTREMTWRDHSKTRQTIELKIVGAKMTYFVGIFIAVLLLICGVLNAHFGDNFRISLALFFSGVIFYVIGYLNYRMILLPSQLMLIFIDLSEDVERISKYIYRN